MARVQAGVLAARALKAHGVDTIFTLSGGHVMPIYEGCRLEGVRVLDVRHEQAAAHAAEGVDPQGDLYASGQFRAHLASVYTKRAVLLAASRAK